MIVNLLRLESECPACGKAGEFVLQFRYGDVWRHRYRLGDMIRFSGGETDVGSPGFSKVVLAAQLNWCRHCKMEQGDIEGYVYVENDRIGSFKVADGTYDFGDNEDDFLVLEE